MIIGLANEFWSSFKWRLKTGFTVLLSVLSSFSIILLRKREQVALLWQFFKHFTKEEREQVTLLVFLLS